MTAFSRIIVVSRSDFLSSFIIWFFDSVRLPDRFPIVNAIPRPWWPPSYYPGPIPSMPRFSSPTFCVVTSQTLLLLTVPNCETEALAYSIPFHSSCLAVQLLASQTESCPKLPEPYLPPPLSRQSIDSADSDKPCAKCMPFRLFNFWYILAPVCGGIYSYSLNLNSNSTQLDSKSRILALLCVCVCARVRSRSIFFYNPTKAPRSRPLPDTDRFPPPPRHHPIVLCLLLPSSNQIHWRWHSPLILQLAPTSNNNTDVEERAVLACMLACSFALVCPGIAFRNKLYHKLFGTIDSDCSYVNLGLCLYLQVFP